MTSDDEQARDQEERPGLGADEPHEAGESSETAESSGTAEYDETAQSCEGEPYESYETDEPFRLSPAEIDEILGTFEPPPPGSPTPPPPDFVSPGRGAEAAPDAGPDEGAGGPPRRQSDSEPLTYVTLGVPPGPKLPEWGTDDRASFPPQPPPTSQYRPSPQQGGAPPGPSFPRTGYPNVVGDPGVAPPGPQFSPGPRFSPDPSPAPSPGPMPNPHQSRASFTPVPPTTSSFPFEGGSQTPQYGTPPGPQFNSSRSQSSPLYGGDALGPAPDLRVPLVRRLLRFLGLGR